MREGDEHYENLRQYKNGVWSFMLEHCRILPSGKMRVIFDTDSKNDFEKRVWSRYKNLYHREDPIAKQEKITVMREEFVSKKAEKKAKYKADKKERREAQAKIKAGIAAVERYNKLPKWRRILIEFFTKNETQNSN